MLLSNVADAHRRNEQALSATRFRDQVAEVMGAGNRDWLTGQSIFATDQPTSRSIYFIGGYGVDN